MSRYAAFLLFLAIGLADPASLTYDDMDDATTLFTTSIAEPTATTPEPTTTTAMATTPEPTTTTAMATTPEPTTAMATTPEPTTAMATTPEPTTAMATTPEPTTAMATTPEPTTTTATTTTTTAAPTTTTTAAVTTTTSSQNITTSAPNTTTPATTTPATTTPATTTPATTTPATTTPATTTPATTTPAPTLPSPATHLYQVQEGNVSCLLVKFGLRLGFQGIKYEEMNFEFTNGTNVTGSCGEDSSELLINSDTLTLKLSFLNDTKKFNLHALNVTGKTSSGVSFTETNSNLTLWQASLGSSYMCNKKQNYTITKRLTIFTFELQVQPFGVQKDSFSTAEDCMPDGESFIVPIAVGVALLVLILIVLVAYFIGRKRNMASAEECFLDSDLSFLVPIAVGVALSFLIILVLISYLIGRRKSRTGYQSV